MNRGYAGLFGNRKTPQRNVGLLKLQFIQLLWKNGKLFTLSNRTIPVEASLSLLVVGRVCNKISARIVKVLSIKLSFF